MEICEACGRSYELPADVQHTFHGGLCPTCTREEAYQEALAQNHDEDDSWKYEGLDYCAHCGAHEDHHDQERCLEIQDQRAHNRLVGGLQRGFASGVNEFIAETGHTWYRSQRRPDQVFSFSAEEGNYCVCLSCGADWVGDPGWHDCPQAQASMLEVIVVNEPLDVRLASWEWR